MDTEDPDNDLTLDQLVLTAYGSNGQALFQSFLMTLAIPGLRSLLGRGRAARRNEDFSLQILWNWLNSLPLS